MSNLHRNANSTLDTEVDCSASNQGPFQRRSALVVAVFVTILVGLCTYFSAVARRSEVLARQNAEKANWLRIVAEKARDDAERSLSAQHLQLYASNMYRANKYWEEGNLGVARELLDLYLPKEGQPDLRGFVWRHLAEKCRGDQLFETVGYEVATSASGSLFAHASDDSVVVRSLTPPFTIVATLESAVCLAFSRDGKWLAAGSDQGVTIWTTKDWQVEKQWQDASFPLKFSPDGRWFAFRRDNGLQLVGTDSWHEEMRPLPLEPWAYGWWNHRHSLEFSLDGNTLIYPGPAQAPDLRGTWQFFDLQSQRPIERLNGVVPASASISLAPNGRHLAVGGRSGRADVEVWDLTSLQKVHSLREHRYFVTRVKYTPNGQYLVSAGGDQVLNVWDGQSYEHIQTLRGHLGEVWSLDIGADSRTVVTGAILEVDGVKLWDIRKKANTERKRVAGFPLGLYAEGEKLLTVDVTGDVRAWDTSTNAPPEHVCSLGEVRVGNVGNVFLAAGVSPNGKHLVFGMEDGTMQGWDLLKSRPLAELPKASSSINVVAWHPTDDAIFAVGAADGSVMIWDIDSRTRLGVIRDEPGSIHVLCLNPTAKTIGIGSRGPNGPRFCVYGYESKPRELYSFDDRFDSAAFTSDGEMLAIGSWGNVVFREAEIGKQLGRLGGHGAATEAMVFLADGKTLMTACNDQSVKFWHLDTGIEMLSLRCDPLPLAMIAQAVDPQRLVIVSRASGAVVSTIIPSMSDIDHQREWGSQLRPQD